MQERKAQAIASVFMVGVALVSLADCSFFAPTFEDYARARDRPDAATAGLTDAANLLDAANDSNNSSEPVCAPNLGDCNGVAEDGCESSLDTVEHCGSCDVACINEHGITSCAGAAGIQSCAPTCAPGFADCDLNADNGCETNIDTDSTNCGACGFTCPPNGGTARCSDGVCGVSSCNAGFGDCANSGHCDANLNSDPKNCGHCGRVCASEHGSATCNGGVCEIECVSGWGDCNRDQADGGQVPEDGCETQLNIPNDAGDVPNCGACGALCKRRALTTVNLAQCALGVCARDCWAGTADCDNNRNQPGCNGSTCGCEIHTASDADNCGACGKVCASGKCAGSKCQ